MICIHPAVTSKPLLLKQLELRTGLRSTTGNRYARLVSRTPRVNVVTNVRSHLLCCTRCEVRNNTQCVGEKCRRCKQGIMMFWFDNGGDAA